MSGGPLPLALRLLAFLIMEGVIVWNLATGLRKGRFAFFGTPERVDRMFNPVRYWTWVGFLVAAIAAVAWLAWEAVGWDLVIVAACAHDVGYCP